MALSRWLIKIRTSIKPGNLTFGKALLSDQIETTSRNESLISLEPYQIKSHVNRQLRDLYLPTEQDLMLLQKFVHTARSHHEATYPNDIQYLQGLYTSYLHFEVEQQLPMCLTGPAGVGKSSLLNAFNRLLPESTELRTKCDLGPIQLSTHWHMRAKARTSFVDLILPFIEQELGQEKRNPTQARAVGLGAKAAFKTGVSFMAIDEMQFVTQGHSAHAAITKLLYQLTHIGIPFVFAANFSLCRTLKNRPEQDRQRLLSNPVVLIPPEPDSHDWSDYLQAVAHVLGSSLKINVSAERHALHHITAGVKRLTRQLLEIAYELAWYKGQRYVTMQEVKAAYNHTAYTTGREQAQAMLSPHTQKSKEYNSPFSLPKTKADALLQTQKENYAEKILSQVQQSALLASEKKALEKVEKPKPSTRPKRAKLTAEELKANAIRLNQSFAR